METFIPLNTPITATMVRHDKGVKLILDHIENFNSLNFIII